MVSKIFAQVSIKPNKRLSKKKVAENENSIANEILPSKAQLKNAQNKLVEAGCEITSMGPTIGIAMDIEEFNVLFSTNLSQNISDQQSHYDIIIPEKLKDIIREVSIATLPDYY